jgi:hypothetical protein
VTGQADLFGGPIAFRRPQEPIVRRALIEGCYRRWLFRGWSAGPVAFWGMLNPSEGSADRDDPTLWQVMKISCRLGFGSAYVGNLYPLISSKPDVMYRWRDTFEADPGERDSYGAFVRNILDVADLCRRCDAHFAAWGDGVGRPADLLHWLMRLDEILKRPIAWECFGLNASGSPKHPLARGKHRIPDDMQPIAWTRS